MKKTKLRLNFSSTAVDSLDGIVAPDVVDDLRAAGDAHPVIKVYSVGHEGKATPHAPTPSGAVKVSLYYMREAVKKICQRLQQGTRAFRFHEDKGADKRAEVGQVVGKALRQIGDKLHTLAAIYVYPAYRNEKLDIASIEADCTLELSDQKEVFVSEIGDISAVALSSSDRESPAFPGATLKAAFSFFAGEIDNPLNKSGGSTMENPTKEDIVRAIGALNLKPSDVFGEAQIKADAGVKSAVDAAVGVVKKLVDSQSGELKNLHDRLADATSGRETADKRVKELEVTATRRGAGDALNTLAQKRNLDAKQQAFCQRALSGYNAQAENPEGLTVEMEKFIDTQLKARDVWLKSEGVESGNGGTEEGKEQNVAAGTGSGDKSGRQTQNRQPENPFKSEVPRPPEVSEDNPFFAPTN